jgi:hypothetical protein
MADSALAHGALVERAVAAIDSVNAHDPVTLVVDGVDRPKEVVHAERMTHWVTTLDPDADAAQLIAARAHHLRRWAVARSTYPEGRSGYLRWRVDQRKRQVAELSEMLSEVGIPIDVTERALDIVAKKGLGTDPAVQTHEDALCLVFLELQVDELAARLDRDHMVEVLRKSVAKMSERGIAAAATIALSEVDGDLLSAAVAAHRAG